MLNHFIKNKYQVQQLKICITYQQNFEEENYPLDFALNVFYFSEFCKWERSTPRNIFG